ncbi:MAG: lysophospholipid acyltransferase family protein [Acidobacteriia bacterium]|nr:lysophospholipid acyltransferase family protein [Terriglobia bacterium]
MDRVNTGSRGRSSLRDIAEFLLVFFVLKSLEWSPLPLAHRLARGYFRLLDLLLPRLRNIAARNLAIALPELSPEKREAIIAGVFRSIARLAVTMAKFPSIQHENIGRWIRFEGYEHFEAALRAGRGVLFATAHLGNWELSAYAHALCAEPMNVVVRPLDNPLLDSLIARRRQLCGNRVISKRDPIRPILKALAANEAVGILIDQNVSSDAVFVDFFGIPAAAASGFARLAAHSGAAVIPGFALWSEPERRYVLRFYPPVPITGDAVRDTQTIQTVLEGVIRAYPDQWLWIHRRWKTRPPGALPVYEVAPVRSNTV